MADYDFLNKVKDSDDEMAKVRAKYAALAQIAEDEKLGQQLKGGYKDAPSLNVRRFGPYELRTLLEPLRDKDSQHDMAMDKLINEVRYLGGEHSEADKRKIAEELKDINKPTDYDYWSKTLGALKQGDSALQGISRLSETTGPAPTRPLWYDEDEDKLK
jgi:hypothetical protein